MYRSIALNSRPLQSQPFVSNVIDSIVDYDLHVNGESSKCFTALGASVFQFDRQTREKIYQNLGLNHNERTQLDDYDAYDITGYSERLGHFLEQKFRNLDSLSDPIRHLYESAERMGIRLIVLVEYENERPSIYQYTWCQLTLSKDDYRFLSSETCVALAVGMRILEEKDEKQESESPQYDLNITPLSLGITQELTRAADDIEQCIKAQFGKVHQPENLYQEIANRFLSFKTKEEALNAFRNERHHLSELSRLIREGIGNNPMAVILKDEKENVFCTCDVPSLLGNQHLYLASNVEMTGTQLYRAQHDTDLNALSVFLNRKSKCDRLGTLYKELGNPTVKNSSKTDNVPPGMGLFSWFGGDQPAHRRCIPPRIDSNGFGGDQPGPLDSAIPRNDFILNEIRAAVDESCPDLDSNQRKAKTDIIVETLATLPPDVRATRLPKLFYDQVWGNYDRDILRHDDISQTLFGQSIIDLNPDLVLGFLGLPGGFSARTRDKVLEVFKTLNPRYQNSQKLPFKREIEQIREKIAEIRTNHSPINQATDANEPVPIHLLAEICVAIKAEFQWEPRDTQLLAVLALLSGDKKHLAQVNTSEGKTVIVAILAIVNIKRGHHVDIVTSAKNLSYRDFKNFENFYKRFGIEVGCNHHPNQKEKDNLSTCYQSTGKKIIYGDLHTFQTDTLNNYFFQKKIFFGREADVLILDECDDALIDKAVRICALSECVSGMVTLHPLLETIYCTLRERIETALQESGVVTPYEIEEIKKTVKEELEKKLPAYLSHSGESLLIPDYLHPFVIRRMPYWVESAVNAICNYSNGVQYFASDGQKKVIPIDYTNTGEWEDALQYQDGLHIFLNMVNGYESRSETLTKSFVSSVGFYKSYSTLYGLSGTLGGPKEFDLFKSIYGCDITIIPTFAEDRFQRLADCLVESDGQWVELIYQDIIQDARAHNLSGPRRRAALVICHSVREVNELEKALIKKGISSDDIVTFTKGDDDQTKLAEATSGKVILATNLAGRGTDIDASKIEQFGGLHVILTFLPINERVEIQAFRRTARKGLSGSGRRILRKQDIDLNGLTPADGKYSTETIDNPRQLRAKEQLEGLECNLKTREEQDVLFKDVQKQFHSIENKLTTLPGFYPVRQQIVDFFKGYFLDQWAIYLDEIKRKSESLSFPDSLSVNVLHDKLDEIVEKNDIYGLQYANVLLDVPQFKTESKTQTPPDVKGALDRAEEIFKQVRRGDGIGGGFSFYNQVYIDAARDPGNLVNMKVHLREAIELFEKVPAYRIVEAHNNKHPENKLVSPLHRLFKSMILASNAAIQEIAKNSGNRLVVKFANPYDLADSPESTENDSKKESPPSEDGERIPNYLIRDAIKLGFKGPLSIKRESAGRFWAFFMAALCVAVAAGVIALLVLGVGAAGGLASVAIGVGLGAAFGAAVDGAIYAIKAGINDEFYFDQFGQRIAIGAVGGALGGAVAGGLFHIAKAAIQGGGLLVRVGIMGGIGAAAGVAGGIGGYVAGAGIQGYSLTWSRLGKVALNGVVCGALGGGIAGLFGAQKLGMMIAGDFIGGFVGGAAAQGIQIALGDRDRFDAWEFLEDSLKAGLNGAVMGYAQNWGKNRLAKNYVIESQMPQKPKEWRSLLDHFGGYSRSTVKALFKKGFITRQEKVNGVKLGHQLQNGHIVPTFNGKPVRDLKPIYGDCVEQAILFQKKAKELLKSNRPVSEVYAEAKAHAECPKKLLEMSKTLNPYIKRNGSGKAIRGYKRLTDVGRSEFESVKFKTKFEEARKTSQGKFAECSYRDVIEAAKAMDALTQDQLGHLFRNKNEKKFGDARIHALEGDLDGFISVDLKNEAAIKSANHTATKTTPGAYRLLYQICGDTKRCNLLRFVGMVDTHSNAQMGGTPGVPIEKSNGTMHRYPGFPRSDLFK